MTVDTKVVYYSKQHKNPLDYTKTHDAPYRYLAYRDIPQIIKKYLQGGEALDYGAGTGYSTQFLSQLGFNVVGVDINKEMVHQAQLQYPNLSFYPIENAVIPFKDSTFDLVFSCFVLLEISTPQGIIDYLLEARRVMKKTTSSLFVAITGSEYLHDTSKKWLDFKTDFPENKKLLSGNLVKLYHDSSQIEFSDYYWTLEDYRSFFVKAGFHLLEVKFPLGKKEESFSWKDELVFSPSTIFVAIPK